MEGLDLVDLAARRLSIVNTQVDLLEAAMPQVFSFIRERSDCDMSKRKLIHLYSNDREKLKALGVAKLRIIDKEAKIKKCEMELDLIKKERRLMQGRNFELDSSTERLREEVKLIKAKLKAIGVSREVIGRMDHSLNEYDLSSSKNKKDLISTKADIEDKFEDLIKSIKSNAKLNAKELVSIKCFDSNDTILECILSRLNCISNESNQKPLEQMNKLDITKSLRTRLEDLKLASSKEYKKLLNERTLVSHVKEENQEKLNQLDPKLLTLVYNSVNLKINQHLKAQEFNQIGSQQNHHYFELFKSSDILSMSENIRAKSKKLSSRIDQIEKAKSKIDSFIKKHILPLGNELEEKHSVFRNQVAKELQYFVNTSPCYNPYSLSTRHLKYLSTSEVLSMILHVEAFILRNRQRAIRVSLEENQLYKHFLVVREDLKVLDFECFKKGVFTAREKLGDILNEFRNLSMDIQVVGKKWLGIFKEILERVFVKLGA